MRFPQIIKRAALQLTLPCAPRPPLLQTRLFDMNPNIKFLFLQEARLNCEAEAEAREEKAASERARREAARLAVAGGTSASGAGGGGTKALGSTMNLDDDIAAVSAMLFLQTS